jgi:hypothetical protein
MQFLQDIVNDLYEYTCNMYQKYEPRYIVLTTSIYLFRKHGSNLSDTHQQLIQVFDTIDKIWSLVDEIVTINPHTEIIQVYLKMVNMKIKALTEENESYKSHLVNMILINTELKRHIDTTSYI